MTKWVLLATLAMGTSVATATDDNIDAMVLLRSGNATMYQARIAHGFLTISDVALRILERQHELDKATETDALSALERKTRFCLSVGGMVESAKHNIGQFMDAASGVASPAQRKGYGMVVSNTNEIIGYCDASLRTEGAAELDFTSALSRLRLIATASLVVGTQLPSELGSKR